VGVEVVYAANHWVKAVDTHRRNHPGVRHVCQNVDLIDLTSLPPFDLLIASPTTFILANVSISGFTCGIQYLFNTNPPEYI
jgi:site-specific DNA-cytosine methylase